MIVSRGVFPYKFGKAAEALELARQVKSWYDKKNVPYRVYTAYYGQYDVIVIEYEAATLGDLQKLDEEYWADPSNQPLNEKWLEIGERGRTGEAWVRHEF